MRRAVEITIAENAGFCFGVKRATESLEKRIQKKSANERIYTLGTLIHNESYNEWLTEQGVGVTDMEHVPELAASTSRERPVTVFVRAHGIPKQDEERLCKLAEEYAGFCYVDCTCPYVKKIHGIAEKYSDADSVFMLLGGEDHPEVVGILSFSSSSFAVENTTFSCSK